MGLGSRLRVVIMLMVFIVNVPMLMLQQLVRMVMRM